MVNSIIEIIKNKKIDRFGDRSIIKRPMPLKLIKKFSIDMNFNLAKSFSEA